MSLAARIKAAGVPAPSARSALGKSLRGKGVADSAELRRILDAPQREPYELAPDEVRAISVALRRPGSNAMLWERQARALYEVATYGALFAELDVGEGKTLISFLAPAAAEAKRPVLVVPAGLVQKTIDDFARLSREWPRFENYPIVSYEALGREAGADILESLRPDLLVCDESHRIKNPRAAVTRRVLRYLATHEECRLFCMSGTPSTRSLREVAHAYERTHRAASPLPLTWAALEEWDLAVSEKLPADRMRPPAGALEKLYREEHRAMAAVEELGAARAAVGARIRRTPGIVAGSGAGIGASLEISIVRAAASAAQRAAFARLYDDWELPDGEPLSDPASVWRHAREIALGFFYRWRDQPPREWLDARRAWAKVCRHVLGANRSEIDSEAQLKSRLDSGAYAHAEASRALAEWRAVAGAFEPVTIPEWFDADALARAVANVLAEPQIVWVEHVAVGEALEAMGIPYHGGKGLDARGESIDRASGTVAASIAACSTGRNLQAWSRSLVLTPMPRGDQWQQLIGRTHREGQQADAVEVSARIGCYENEKDLEQARADAERDRQMTGRPQKLAIATWIEGQKEREG